MAATSNPEWDRSLMPQGVVKNMLVALSIFVTSALIAFLAAKHADVNVVINLLKELWVVQAVLATAVVSLIYRLQSDTSMTGNLTSAQRARLDAMVQIKSRRLWCLFVAIAATTFLARFSAVVPMPTQRWMTIAATILMVGTTLYCAYLPSMWNELRKFVTLLSAEKEAAERRNRELERLGGNL